jgi:hypothetical protein
MLILKGMKNGILAVTEILIQEIEFLLSFGREKIKLHINM